MTKCRLPTGISGGTCDTTPSCVSKDILRVECVKDHPPNSRNWQPVLVVEDATSFGETRETAEILGEFRHQNRVVGGAGDLRSVAGTGREPRPQQGYPRTTSGLSSD